MANFEKTSRMFQSRFKQPYSLCACDKSARTKITGSLSIAPKKATNAADVLRALGVDPSTASQPTAAATHPCSHSVIVPNVMPTSANSKLKGRSLHRNTILDPPADWHDRLVKDAYGYGPAVRGDYDTPLAPLRPWATTV